MLRWYVITPEYETVDRILPDGSGPTEIGCDVVEVEAPTRRRAKIAGVRELRRQKSQWMRYQDIDRHSPFTGLQVEPFEEGTCEHEYLLSCSPCGRVMDTAGDPPVCRSCGESHAGTPTCYMCGEIRTEIANA